MLKKFPNSATFGTGHLPVTVHLLWGADVADWYGDYHVSLGLKAEKYPTHASGCASYKVRMSPTYGPTYVVALKHWANDSAGLGILSHEAFHAVERIMWFAGGEHCRKSSENWAYLLDSLVTRMYEALPGE